MSDSRTCRTPRRWDGRPRQDLAREHVQGEHPIKAPTGHEVVQDSKRFPPRAVIGLTYRQIQGIINRDPPGNLGSWRARQRAASCKDREQTRSRSPIRSPSVTVASIPARIPRNHLTRPTTSGNTMIARMQTFRRVFDLRDETEKHKDPCSLFRRKRSPRGGLRAKVRCSLS
jgi:hypothetical protein